MTGQTTHSTLDFTNILNYENIAIVVLCISLYVSCKAIAYLFKENISLGKDDRAEHARSRDSNTKEMREMWSNVLKQNEKNNELIREITASSKRNGS